MARTSLPPLFGEAVADEIQLDGSRHLTLEAVDADDVWRATLHLVIDEEKVVREGEMVLEGPIKERLEGPAEEWSGALAETLAFSAEASAADSGMRLRARFSDVDGVAWQVEVDATDDEIYRLQIDADRSMPTT